MIINGTFYSEPELRAKFKALEEENAELKKAVRAERYSSKAPVKTVDECKAVLLDHLCTECGSLCADTDSYCAECGAKMDGETT